MKFAKTFLIPLLGLFALAAQALDVQPYSAKAVADAQAAGKPYALHFHADWCPTCRAQDASPHGRFGFDRRPGLGSRTC